MILTCLHALRRGLAILAGAVAVAALATPAATAGNLADARSRAPADVRTLQPRAQPAAAIAAGGIAEVVEYYQAGLLHYFITADPAEIAALDGGALGGAWKRTGNTFPAWEAGGAPTVAITVPVCRFFGTDQYRADGSRIGPNSHFYTADPGECEYVKTAWPSLAANGVAYPAWQHEGSAFAVVLPVAGACPAGTQALYRAYNNGANGDPNHRYSQSAGTLQGMAGWIFEGLVMCLPASAGAVLPATLAGCGDQCPEAFVLGNGIGLVNAVVQVTNAGATPLVLAVAPGQLFVASSGDVQNGIALESLQATIPPGSARTFVLALFCINATRHPSDEASVYTPAGVTANAALLELSSLVDGKLADPLGLKSFVVQLAVWEITDGPGSLSATQKNLIAAMLALDSLDPAFGDYFEQFLLTLSSGGLA